jgi:phosphatidylserine/phosphatidylglycerophosphate/cardiolipin synthase-like enzyme
MNRLLLVSLLGFSTACAHTAEPDPTDLTPDGLTADDSAPAADFCGPTDPRATPVEVFATPEAGEAPYLEALDAATSSIDVQVYLMGYGGILDRLIAKAEAGLAVRVILDRSKIDTNQKYFDLLVAAGAEVKWSDAAFTYTHSKYFIVDDRVAVMSTGNYSKSFSIDKERNFVAVDRDPADVHDLVTLFDADWTRSAPVMDCTRMIVSPINARQRILELIASAQTTLTIESMQFADTDVREAVDARITAGVDVRVLLADADWIDANASAATFLKDRGVTVKWIPHLHTKAIVADGVRAYIGSENLSWTSLTKNREVGVIVVEDSSIAPITATFDKDWAAGTLF